MKTKSRSQDRRHTQPAEFSCAHKDAAIVPRAAAALGVAFLILLPFAALHAATIWIGETHGEVGELVAVPVWLDDAAGLAGFQIQVNYDPSFLQFEGIETNGTLSAAFTTAHTNQDGVVRVACARAESLLSGSGALFNILLRPVPGSVPGVTMGELVLAETMLGGDLGRNLDWQAPTSASNGVFWVVYSRTLDSDGDGATDYEEQMSDGSPIYNPYHPILNPTGTGSDIHNTDTDGDGVPDGVELAAGFGVTDPHLYFALGNTAGYPAFEWTPDGPRLRWWGIAGRAYQIQWTTNAGANWDILPGADGLPGLNGENVHLDTTPNPAGVTRWYRLYSIQGE